MPWALCCTIPSLDRVGQTGLALSIPILGLQATSIHEAGGLLAAWPLPFEGASALTPGRRRSNATIAAEYSDDEVRATMHDSDVVCFKTCTERSAWRPKLLNRLCSTSSILQCQSRRRKDAPPWTHCSESVCL